MVDLSFMLLIFLWGEGRCDTGLPRNYVIFTLLFVCLWEKYYICGSRSGDDDFVRLRSSVQLLA